MANEPGLYTELVTDNRKFDRSMKRSESLLEGVERKLHEVGAAGARSGVRLSRVNRVMDTQGRETGDLSTQLARLENEYLNVGNAASRTAQRVTQNARGFRIMRGQLYNASVQMQDFAVQVGAGTSALTAFSQNAPQFLSFFGPKAALIGAFIAALPLLKVGIESVMGAFRDFDDDLEDGNKALDAYISSLEKLNENFSGAFDRLTAEINATSVATADLARIHEQRAVSAIRATAEALADANTEAGLWRKITGGTDIGLAGDLLEIETLLRGNITTWKENRAEVRQFIDAVRSIDDAGTIQGMYEAALRARDIFADNVDITGDMTAEQMQFLEQTALLIQMLERAGATQEANSGTLRASIQYYESLNRAAALRAQEEERQQKAYAQYYDSRISGEEFINNQLEEQRRRVGDVYSEYVRSREAADEVKVELTDAAIQASLIAESDMSSPIAQAARDALELAANLGIAVEEAAALELERRAADVANARNIAYAGRGTTSDVPAFQVDDQGRRTPVSTILSEAERDRRATGSRGGGAGRVDQFASRLEQLRESLLTEEQLERESYERRTELLEKFLQRQPEKLTEYQELQERLQRDHQRRMAEIDVYRYGDTLQKTGAFFGEMAAAFEQGNEKMFKIAQAFGAAEALINAWRAYSQVIGDPTVPWFAKLAKAAAVLSAGLGAVQAIKGASPGGSSGGGGAAAVGGAAAAPIPTQTVSINLQGDTFSRATVEGLLEQIQSQLDRGGRLVFS